MVTAVALETQQPTTTSLFPALGAFEQHNENCTLL